MKPISSIISFILYPYRRLLLNAAIAKADSLYAKYGERFYVTWAADDRLTVINRKQFRIMKAHNYISKKAFISDLLRESLYFTPDRGGNSPITPHVLAMKRKMYFQMFR